MLSCAPQFPSEFGVVELWSTVIMPFPSPLVNVLTAMPLPGTLVPLTDIKVYGAAIAALSNDHQRAVRIKHTRVILKFIRAVASDGRIVVMSVSPKLKI